nr:chaplin family protein [Glycomyces sp. L485]
MISKDNVGLGDGNQLYAPIQAPINVCGNAIAILGTADAYCEGGSDADIDEPDHQSHKKAGYTESSDAEAADADLSEEHLPSGGVPGLDTVTAAAGGVAGGLPIVGGLGDNVTPEDVASTATGTVGGLPEAAGAGLL